MQFYKICGELIVSEAESANEVEKRTRKDIAHKIAAKTAEFNDADNTKCRFLSDIGDEYVTFGIIATHVINLVEFAEKLCKSIGVQVKLGYPDEITFGNLQNLLSNADRQSYIADDNEILERFGLDRISKRYGRGLEFGENLVNDNAWNIFQFSYNPPLESSILQLVMFYDTIIIKLIMSAKADINRFCNEESRYIFVKAKYPRIKFNCHGTIENKRQKSEKQEGDRNASGMVGSARGVRLFGKRGRKQGASRTAGKAI